MHEEGGRKGGHSQRDNYHSIQKTDVKMIMAEITSESGKKGNKIGSNCKWKEVFWPHSRAPAKFRTIWFSHEWCAFSSYFRCGKLFPDELAETIADELIHSQLTPQPQSRKQCNTIIHRAFEYFCGPCESQEPIWFHSGRGITLDDAILSCSIKPNIDSPRLASKPNPATPWFQSVDRVMKKSRSTFLHVHVL